MHMPLRIVFTMPTLRPRTTYQLLQLDRSCSGVWGTNPTALASLRDALADNSSTARLQLQLVVTRQLGLGATQLQRSVRLNAAQRALMARAATEWAPGSGGGDGSESSIAIEVLGLFPKFGQFGSTSSVAQASALADKADAWHTMQNLTVVAHRRRGDGLRWWSVHQSGRDASPFNTTSDDGVQLVAAADRLAGGTAASSLTGGGVLATHPTSR